MHKHYYIYSVFDSKPFIIIISLWCTFMYAFDDVHDNSMSFPGISQSINHFYWEKKKPVLSPHALMCWVCVKRSLLDMEGPFLLGHSSVESE